METGKSKGGRPKGSISKIARAARLNAIATGELPHEFLLRVSRGEIITRRVVDEDGNVTEIREDYDFPMRIDAAKSAAPYFAPKISTVEVIHGVPDDELDNIIAQLAAQAGINLSADGEESEDEDQPCSTRRVILD